MLYICFGDGGSSLNFQEGNVQNKASFLGSIFRIEPLGNDSANGQYGIPPDNPFVKDESALGEIYMYGFRNPHRICWDTEGDHKMLIGDIGEKNIEEVNIGKMGANYGWGKREGTFEYIRALGRESVYQLPHDDSLSNYTYPAAQYDHDEGLAIVGGYVYRGSLFPDLVGHYIFGDIPSGRVFHVPVDDLKEGTIAEIKELNFKDSEGARTTFLHLVQNNRADLRFGIDSQGEIYFLTKTDGKIWRLKSETTTAVTESATIKISFHPNPAKDILYVEGITDQMEYEIINVNGHTVQKGSVSENSEINIAQLSTGIFFIKYKIGRGEEVKKFVKL